MSEAPDNVVQLEFEARCEACGSHRVDTGGTKVMGRVEVDGVFYEVLEQSDLTTTCSDCGMKTRVITTPTEASTLAFIRRGGAPHEVAQKGDGDLVWKGELEPGIKLDVTPTRLPCGGTFVRIDARR